MLNANVALLENPILFDGKHICAGDKGGCKNRCLKILTSIKSDKSWM